MKSKRLLPALNSARYKSGIFLLKVLKWTILSILSALILMGGFFWLIASGIDETTVYTEKDFFNYHLLTDKAVEKAPRISDSYYFKSHPGDGYAPSNSIFFRGASGTEPLQAYLKKLGYTRQRSHPYEGETWTQPGQIRSNIFYIYVNNTTGEVEFTKVINN